MNKSKAYINRRSIILTIIALIALIFLLRIFWLQIIDDSYKASASSNSRRDLTIYPSRGLIYDRNGELLVYNEAVYDLMVVPHLTQVEDTLTLSELIGIAPETFRKRIQKAWSYSSYKQSIFEKQIPKHSASILQEQLYKYPGFYLRPRTLRSYPRPIAAHVLGYLGEVNQEEIEQSPYYKQGDYIGKSGLEKRYESELRGVKGVRKQLVDVHNTVMGSYMDGRFDTAAIAGKDIISTLDAKLQEYGEHLMRNKTGAIVAIEPGSGEILSLISTPAYDPNILVGRIRSANYFNLLHDSLRPLFNRALMASYPPGSIFKVINALIALDMNVIDSTDYYPCNQSKVGCHSHPKADNVHKSIQFSCNPYYYKVFQKTIQQGKTNSIYTDSRIGLQLWRRMVLQFGLGQSLGIDLQNVKPGYIPSPAFYDRWYGKNRWAFSTIYSLGIGQGEVEITPLQMANMAATIANRGFYIDPHLVKKIGGQAANQKALEPQQTNINRTYFDYVTEAMRAVVEDPGGTARRAKIPDITVCGKTGTVQNPHGENHSVFMAFAPKNNPQIAVAVYVENAGYGGSWAAPVASLMIEKYLTDSIQRTQVEERILNKKFNNYAPFQQ